MSTGDTKLLRIRGRVLDQKTQQGIAALRVEACDKALIVKEPLLTTFTDQQGSFIFEFKKGRLKDFFGDRQALIFFKVFRDTELIANTQNSITWSRESPDEEIIIQVEPKQKKPKPIKISGQIRSQDGNAIHKAIVRAFITTPGKEISLGETQTDSGGNYQITSTDQALTTQPDNALVEVRVFDKKGNLLGASSSAMQERSTTMDVTLEPERCVVHGQVLQKHGKSLSAGIVRLYGVVPRERAIKDTTITSTDDGFYRIEYEPGEFSVRLSDNNSVELRVFRVVDGQEQLLVQDPPTPQFRTNDDEFVKIFLRDDIDVPPVQPRTFTVQGVITRGGRGLGNEILIVQAFDGATPLGQPTPSGANGSYLITYKVGPNGDISTNPNNLIVRVFDGSTRLGESALGRPAGESEIINVNIPAEPPQPPGDFTVEVHVKSGEFAVAGVFVQTIKLDIGGRTPLGTKTTDANGLYQITYTINPSSPRQNADLLIRVFTRGPGNVETDLVTPLFIPQADKHLTLEIDIPGFIKGPSEYELLAIKVAEQLGTISITSLNDGGLALLTLRTQSDPLHITYFATAARHSGQTGIRPEAFYGLFRKNLPTELPVLLAQTREAQSNALQGAIDENIVLQTLQAQLVGILDRLRALITDQALQPGAGGTVTLGALLNLVFTDPQKQRSFLNLYLQRPGSINRFWTDLRNNPTFRNDVDNLQFTLQAAALTQNHIPLIQELQLRRRANSLRSLRDLVSLDVGDWLNIINQPSGQHTIGFPQGTPGENGEEKARNYATTIVQIVVDSFPTATIANRMAGDNWPRNKSGLQTFFTNNSSFDFASTSLRSYLAENNNALINIPAGEAPGVVNELEGMERVFNITPRHREFTALMSNGFDSAHSITRLSQNAFIGSYAPALGGETQALAIYNRASNVSAMALVLLGRFGNLNPVIDIPVMPGGPSSSSIADLATLFGSMDLCECRDCNSVFGPAAYFVDILEFLNNRDAGSGGKTAKDILLGRRPDLADIELTCENTNTVLPYVDLVNEILENAIAPPIIAVGSQPGDLTTAEITDIKNKLDGGVIAPALKRELSKRGYLLSDNSVAARQGPGRWQITDTGYRFSVSVGSDSGRLSVSASPQTSGKTEELGANPEHVNSAAYDKLKYAVYPLNLPLNLWVEEVRVYLDHLGVPRHELMETFFKGTPNDAIQDDVIVRETLGLTATEAGIITGSIVSGPVDGTGTSGAWTFWGLKETGNVIPNPSASGSPQLTGTWTDLLKRVDVFLQRSGLSFEELEDFLEMKFINPSSTLSIISGDANDPHTCDLSKLIIDQLNATALGRMHRFLRLWRKLGWTTRDLDRAITALARGTNDWTEFLKQLSHIRRLRKRFNLPVVTLLSWFAPIDTAEYGFNKKPRPRSLYEDLFQNPSTRNPKAGESDPFELDKVRNEIKANLTLVITEPDVNAEQKKAVLATLRAALGVRDSDLSVMIAGPRAVVTSDKKLTLHNLTQLYRTASLARAIRLSVEDFLLLMDLVGISPFANAANSKDTSRALEFVKTLGRIRSSGFTIPELDSLLRPQSLKSSIIDPREEDVAAALDEIRGGLQKIFSETEAIPDATGNAVIKALALLKWNKNLVDEVMATLSNVIRYEAPLRELPAGLDFSRDLPGDLSAKVSFDEETPGSLRFVGIMTAAERATLLGLATGSSSVDVNYRDAVSSLFAVPRDFILRSLKAFELPTLATPLDALPPDVVFPAALKEVVFYDSTQRALRFIGPMTRSELTTLLGLTDDQPDKALYKNAVSQLFQAFDSFAPTDKNRFLTLAEAGQLADLATPAERFGFILSKLMAYLRTSQSESFVLQKIAETLKVEAATADLLLRTWVPSAIRPAQTSIADFIDDSFVSTDLQVQLTKEAFPFQFITYVRLQRIATLITRFRVTTQQVAWLFQYSGDAGWLNPILLPLPTDLPLTTPPPPVPFEKLERLIDLFQLRDALPAGEELLSDIFSAARKVNILPDDLLTLLSVGTGWKMEDLRLLAGRRGFDLNLPADFKGERALARLLNCFAIIKRLGVSAEQCLAWTKSDLKATDPLRGTDADLTIADARSAREAVRAKYGSKQWLEAARPLRDPLRDKQRAALAGFLIAHPELVRQPGTWKDTNDLYDYFLIDVEMSPCQMTSRIKQAIASAQLFVQRCLMNLEHDVVASAERDGKWLEWKWRRNYRVWEANRKVFLYPENWIEPELRDDKTPFFIELESDLLQGELTSDAAETALLSYLEKLDEVARLEICAMYHQIETDQPDGSGNIVLDVLHVFARTHGTPPVYYYRQRVDSSYWTAWQRVDLDIQGNHLLAVVWNRRLHLFWPIFTKETDKPTITLPTSTTPLKDPLEFWKVRMAWSEYKNGKWSKRQLTSESVTTQKRLPSQNIVLSDIFFEAGIVDGDLVISVKTYSQVLPTAAPAPDAPPRNPTAESSGSSREVVFLLGGPFIGDYASFRFTGCGGRINIVEDEFSRRSPFSLQGTHTEFMTFVEESDNAIGPTVSGNPSDHPLIITGVVQFPAVNAASLFSFNPNTIDQLFDLTAPSLNCVQVLDKTPGTFRVYTQEFQFFDETKPFFYADDYRTYFVISETLPAPTRNWTRTDQLDLNLLDDVRNTYFAPFNIAPSRSPVVFTATTTKGLLSERASVNSNISNLITPGGIGRLGGSTGNVGLNDGPQLVPTPHCNRRYRFQTFYHPFVCLFVRELNRFGIDGLLKRSIQKDPATFSTKPPFNFKDTYLPNNTNPIVAQRFPVEDVDFEFEGAYSIYNWELFFHVPLLIADKLSKNQRFEEAQKWFHYIFDPTDTSSEPVPQRYWRTRPFFLTSAQNYEDQQVQSLLDQLASGSSDPVLERQVDQWSKKPFNPHLVARLRTTAYQRTVVMKYLENLIGWGDQLFRRDTIESINEATQLYILAARILGRRPATVTPRARPTVQTFSTLPDLGQFSNPQVKAESLVVKLSQNPTPAPDDKPDVTLPDLLYFCAPRNDKLLGYWDTVADRLFKIRHCMNIEGVTRQLPLFEPPIDPALLVKAAAAGIDISSALNDINAALPHYRFNVMAQKAGELCAELKVLGGALLSALEKRDAEALALLRSSHEIKVLDAVRQVKERQVKEAEQTLASLQKSLEMATIRNTYYKSLERFSQEEKNQVASLLRSRSNHDKQGFWDNIANQIYIAPDVKIGAPTSFGATFGGSNLGNAAKAFGGYYGSLAVVSDVSASIVSAQAGWARRNAEWDHQVEVTATEMGQLNKQIAAAEIRLDLANKDLEAHDLQIENARAVDDFMHDKFTNRDLYNWMVGQISGIYFQSYQLAYDVAKRSERAYRFELGLDNSSFIQFGYWDSLKKGLLAGERLYHDLKRMEVAYLDQNRREYELTRHISLLLLDPVALIKLRQMGQCFADLPEALFDMDYPGHYMRRIKSVALTIPCVTGPYTSVNCTLTLLKNSMRRTATSTGLAYSRDESQDDPRFRDSAAAIQSIATSSAQNDPGLFELNFRDERFLPFEGAGAISTWRIELPRETNRFDFNSISDVVIHLRYTAREGGEALRQAAESTVTNAASQSGTRLFSARHEFPGEWHRFMHPNESGPQVLKLNLTADKFPFLLPRKTMQIGSLQLFLKLKGSVIDLNDSLAVKVEPAGSEGPFAALNPIPTIEGVLQGDFELNPVSLPVELQITVGVIEDSAQITIPPKLQVPAQPGSPGIPRLSPDAIEDMEIACHFLVVQLPED